MDEKKFVNFKKNELAVKNYIKSDLGKGKISAVNIEYTPVGEKIVIATSRPGQVIGKRGEKIEELTKVLKKGYKLDNPHIDIREIADARLDAQLVADEIATQMERQGSLKFKVIAYRMLQDIMRAGALGAEIVLSGRLPSERAKSWRFSQGYLKKTGEPAKVVDCAMAQAGSNMGVSGIKVRILPPNAHIHDKIVVDDALKAKFFMPVEEIVVKKVAKKPAKKKEAKK
ncbi:30S ribosomal protein S3 [Candidatus Pacearchaeota archaeon]|nr:30S ribosomal protein S3 [Candidatus Pacearchaeota archaeon]